MTTLLFTQAEYAEDQLYSHAIVTTHVLTRAFTTGALAGGLIPLAKAAVSRSPSTSSSSSSSPTSPASSTAGKTAAATGKTAAATTTPLLVRTLRSAGTGTAISSLLLGLALVGRMQGREEIEWKDRAWRLLANKGQVEVDGWSYSGAVAGAAVTAALGRAAAGGARGIVGGAGLGSLVGVVGYMGWRYGVKRGKF